MANNFDLIVIPTVDSTPSTTSLIIIQHVYNKAFDKMCSSGSLRLELNSAPETHSIQ